MPPSSLSIALAPDGALDPSRIQFLQLNMHYSSYGLTLLSQFLATSMIDVVLIQDPPADLQCNRGKVPGFVTILPPQGMGSKSSTMEKPLVAILVRSSLAFQRLHLADRRVCGILISTGHAPLAVVTSYLHFIGGQGLTALSSMLTMARRHTPFVVIGADANGHSRWWGPPDLMSNATGELVEDFILSEHLDVANVWPSPPTFTSEQGFESWIDVTLSFSPVTPLLSDW